MRKSISLGGGVRLNASKTGFGLSAGTRGARYSVHSSGRRTRSVGLPGSGLSYVTTRSGSSRRAASNTQRQATAGTAASISKPGLFAPAHEKAFAKGVSVYVSGDAHKAWQHFCEAARRDTQDKSAADDLFAGLLAVQLEKTAEAIPYLERVVRSPTELPDDLMRKYIPGGATTIGVTPHVSVSVPFGSTAAALALAEVYQGAGRRDEAIGVLQKLLEIRKEASLTLSLAELLAEEEAWDELVELTAGTKNQDDLTLAICIFQARALESQGMDEAALEVYRDALRSKKRDDELLKRARYARGRLYLRLGKKAQGRKDLSRVYADDPSFEGVADLLRD
jgi:tetratricopeptide (TPR) repeat protein